VRPRTLPPEFGSKEDYERVMQDALAKRAQELREFYRLPDPNDSGDRWRVPLFEGANVATFADTRESVQLINYANFVKEQFRLGDKIIKLWVRA
jgi:hypothetical protein